MAHLTVDCADEQFVDVREVAGIGLIVARLARSLNVPAKPLQQFLLERQRRRL
jgi:hypothetical protein